MGIPHLVTDVTAPGETWGIFTAAAMPSRDVLSSLSREPVVLADPSAADALLMRLAGRTVGFDIETYGTTKHPSAGLDSRVSAVRLAQLFYEQSNTVYIVDCQRAGTGWVRRLPRIHVVAHNASFEVGHLLRLLSERLSFDCTMLAGRVLNGRHQGLQDLARDVAGIDLSKDLQTSNWSAPRLTEEQLCYAASDAVAVLKVWRQLQPMLQGKFRDAYGLLKDLVYPVACQSGIRLDVGGHAALVSQWTSEMAQACERLAQAGLTNPNSTIQKQQYLERVLPMDVLLDWPVTPSGKLSTDADTLL